MAGVWVQMKAAIKNFSGRGGQPGFVLGILISALLWASVALAASVMYLRDVGEVGLAMIVALASGAVGGVAGFLFGIPKSLQRRRKRKHRGRRVISNSNLEEVSDWITKIVVGLGLVEFRAIGRALGDLADRLGPAFDTDVTSGKAFALSLVTASAVIAFLLMYIWTRVRFEGFLIDEASRRRDTPAKDETHGSDASERP
jgi:hypothetical protein